MSHLVIHFEIHASEPEKVIAFYSELLGWNFTRFGEMTYWTIETGEGSVTTEATGYGINGGLTQRRGPRPASGDPVNGAVLVVAVGDVDGIFARGIELGGAEAMAPNTTPGVGRLAYLRDPDGNVFGLISPEMPVV
ncbi:VOC family protein [Klugiella xanthotipulae]|uniref:VOC domain-containing protein n=1 Tax=Klugiella xanthotipulae TaxID=244735 RepID=A0A543HS91_9MICO|nr:VOC family protein [Klugiella xanthotipulae]TQM61129.1 hypothetical protein FB466_2061 [Klugiella xanthotipulae]